VNDAWQYRADRATDWSIAILIIVAITLFLFHDDLPCVWMNHNPASISALANRKSKRLSASCGKLNVLSAWSSRWVMPGSRSVLVYLTRKPFPYWNLLMVTTVFFVLTTAVLSSMAVILCPDLIGSGRWFYFLGIHSTNSLTGTTLPRSHAFCIMALRSSRRRDNSASIWSNSAASLSRKRLNFFLISSWVALTT